MSITQELTDRLYDPLDTGLEIVLGAMDETDLANVNKCIAQNESLFEIKREKFIANNQLVALLYRGPFDKSSMEKTIFADIFRRYLSIRSDLQRFSPVAFTDGSSIEVKLIRYPVSELGVDIHKDLSSNINVIVFFNLEGAADVTTFTDKTGSNPVSHPMRQGDISIMRAPRNKDEADIRPYHAVLEVPESRTVLVVREIDDALEAVVNEGNWRGF